MHIKGPEILNMWVGESERMVREIFQTAREKRREGFLPFLFIDEAESILGTRRASRYSNILSTLVPMFCTEMDGIDSLDEVVIILASNRADLIDPAILRPGRHRPQDQGGSPHQGRLDRHIQNLPHPRAPVRSRPRAVRRRRAAGHRFASSAPSSISNSRIGTKNKFLEVTLRSGKRDVLYRGDLISGAIIASIVERAKSFAIKRAIASQQEEGISESDLRLSLEAEYAENDIFPPTDITEDWLKLIDYDSENVVKVSPIRPGAAAKPSPARSSRQVPMKRIFGIETEYGITVDGTEESVDVVHESIEIVRRYTEYGSLMKWDYNLEDPHQDARGFRAAGAHAGHRRVRLLRNRQEPAAHLRGNQERPRPFERRPLLQRPRPPRVLDARVLARCASWSRRTKPASASSRSAPGAATNS